MGEQCTRNAIHCLCAVLCVQRFEHATIVVVDSISNKRKVISRARRDAKNGGKLKLGVQSPKMIIDAPLYLKKVRVRRVKRGAKGERHAAERGLRRMVPMCPVTG